jgi:hypothetical protein
LKKISPVWQNISIRIKQGDSKNGIKEGLSTGITVFAFELIGFMFEIGAATMETVTSSSRTSGIVKGTTSWEEMIQLVTH